MFWACQRFSQIQMLKLQITRFLSATLFNKQFPLNLFAFFFNECILALKPLTANMVNVLVVINVCFFTSVWKENDHDLNQQRYGFDHEPFWFEEA